MAIDNIALRRRFSRSSRIISPDDGAYIAFTTFRYGQAAGQIDTDQHPISELPDPRFSSVAISTPSSRRPLLASRGRSPTPGRSATRWPPAGSVSRSAQRYMTPPIRWARCSSTILATFAEFEVDLLRMRTREGMAIARANGRLRGKAPKLSARQRVHVFGLAQAGEHRIAELAELFSVSRATISREIARARHDST